MAKRKKKSKDNCPLCDDFMDLYCTGCKKLPFIDGKCYPKLCYACFWVPREYVEKFDANDNCIDSKGPFYDHKHLMTAKELFERGTADSITQAQRSIKAVRAACKAAKLTSRSKPKATKRPKNDTQMTD